MRNLVIGILYDETISRLPLTTRHKDFVFQELKKIERKNMSESMKNNKSFSKAYEIANEAWMLAQRKFKENGLEFSNVLMMKFMRESEPWLNEYFDLSEKRIKKLEDSYDLTKHGFRTKTITRIVLESVNIAIAQHNYREAK